MFLQKISMSLPLLLDQNIWTLYWSEAAGAGAARDARASSALCRAFPPLFSDHYLLNSLGSGCDFKVNCGPFLYPDALQHQCGGPAGAGLQSTSILRAWFSEHRRNPYPTRGEKIMLAIITRMTLTQVSTWFANARRRLKKENRTIWPPAVCKSHLCFSCETNQVTEDHLCERAVKDPIDTGFEERNDLQSPAEQNLMRNQSSRKKPKIWSLAETATMVKKPES